MGGVFGCRVLLVSTTHKVIRGGKKKECRSSRTCIRKKGEIEVGEIEGADLDGRYGAVRRKVET